jgi:hypothetical protein
VEDPSRKGSPLVGDQIMKITVDDEEREFLSVPRVGELIVKDGAYAKVVNVIHGGDPEIFITTKCTHRDVYGKDLWMSSDDETDFIYICKNCGKSHREPKILLTGTNSPSSANLKLVFGEEYESLQKKGN